MHLLRRVPELWRRGHLWFTSGVYRSRRRAASEDIDMTRLTCTRSTSPALCGHITITVLIFLAPHLPPISIPIFLSIPNFVLHERITILGASRHRAEQLDPLSLRFESLSMSPVYTQLNREVFERRKWNQVIVKFFARSLYHPRRKDTRPRSCRAVVCVQTDIDGDGWV